MSTSTEDDPFQVQQRSNIPAPSPSPERRSAADLQKVLDSLIGQAGSVLSGDLPGVLSRYEIDHDIVIIEPAEWEGLKALCQQHSELELGPKELFSFLSMIPKPQRHRPVSPTPFLPHSTSLPPSSFPKSSKYVDNNSTPRQRTQRRHSDRIRSPSDGSASSSDDDDNNNVEEALRRRNDRQTSAPPPGSQPFPGATGAATFSPPPQPLNFRRQKTLSDSSKHDSPLTVRIRGNIPPSSFGFAGTPNGSFARPSPAGRRRKGSNSGASNNGNGEGSDDPRSPELPPTPGFGSQYSRSASTGSVSLGNQGRGSRDTSPMSPMLASLDHTSYYGHSNGGREKSPELVEELDYVDESMNMGEDETNDDDMGENGFDGDIADPRLSSISTKSTNSLRTTHDKLRKLQKVNTELARKLKESEKQLAVLGAENERLVEDLQDKLEEARAEIATRRKDEKDMKSKERAQLIQISGLEADLQSLQRSLENSKSNHASMQKMYNSQCDEAQRLRDLLRDREDEISNLESDAQTHQADEERTKHEVQLLEHEIKRLENDLTLARQAESHLEVQKQENLALRETIDRMRFDLDEARAVAASIGNSSSSNGNRAGVASGPVTLSRNLGDELNRKLQEAERVQKGEEERNEEEDGFVETVVTTQTTRKVGGKRRDVSGNNAAGTSGQQGSNPTIRIEEVFREYADAGVNTEIVELEDTVAEAGPSTLPVLEHPPAYTATPTPINEKQVLEQAHPRHDHAQPTENEDLDEVSEEYDVLVDGLGVRCTVLEEELKNKKAERAKRLADGIAPRSSSRSRRRYGKSVVGYIYSGGGDIKRNQVTVAALCVGAAFAIGTVFGAQFFSFLPNGMDPRDIELFTAMNTIAVAAGAGEGFLPIGQRGLLGFMEGGAKMIAGRVPT